MQDHTVSIRSASRRLVRELGFMGGPFAGTELPPSAVHALIEIDARPGISARDLGLLLRLEKSSVSRMLQKLTNSAEIETRVDADDTRVKGLFLTDAGQERVLAIHSFGSAQVSDALAHLRPDEAGTVAEGLRLYADALDRSGDRAPSPDVRVTRGYRPGVIARVTEMHALFYARTVGFGRRFETVIAGGLADFCERIDSPVNALWTALRNDDVVGSIAIDGEDLGGGVAHLRWFIVDDGVRGGGVGRKLMSEAMNFVDERGFAETHLWTFDGLPAARKLYESHGFRLVEERPGDQWGREVMEQRFVRPRGG